MNEMSQNEPHPNISIPYNCGMSPASFWQMISLHLQWIILLFVVLLLLFSAVSADDNNTMNEWYTCGDLKLCHQSWSLFFFFFHQMTRLRKRQLRITSPLFLRFSRLPRIPQKRAIIIYIVTIDVLIESKGTS